MKIYIYILLAFFSVNIFAQKVNAIDISDSEYVVLEYRDVSKNGVEPGIKFINSETGQVVNIKLDDDSSIRALEHVKLDLINFNAVLVIINKIDPNSGNGIYSNMIQTYSPDGKLVNSVSINEQISDYVINHKTGKIILIMGGSSMKNSKNIEQVEAIYDLKTLKKV